MKNSNRHLLHNQWLTALLPIVVTIAAACGPSLPGTGSSVPTDWPQANHDLANTRVALMSGFLVGN